MRPLQSLTSCQVNTTRVAGRRIIRRKTAGPGSESLTPCQVNTTRVAGRRIMRRKTAGPAVNHSHPVKSIQSEWQVEHYEKKDSWT